MRNLKELPKKELIALFEFITSCLSATDEKHFCNLIEYFKSFVPHDFTVCGIAKVKNQALSDVIDIVNVSYPKEWMALYFKNNFQRIDPIMHTHFSHFKPQIWSKTYQKYPDIDPNFLSMAQDFGLIEGLTYGVMEPGNSIGSLFSFAGSSQKLSRRHIAFLELIVPHLHQALIRILKEKKKRGILKESGIALPLSLREIEILNWLKLGKTNWETSVILNISERTVKFHVHNIMRKLNAVTRGHAVAKAIELGIIEL